MSDATERLTASTWDVEQLLSDALRPIEPPERFSGRVEDTLSAVTQAAVEELSDWAEELSESELARPARPAQLGAPRGRGHAPAVPPPAPWCCLRPAAAASRGLAAVCDR